MRLNADEITELILLIEKGIMYLINRFHDKRDKNR